MRLPDGLCRFLPSTPLCRSGGGGPCEVASLLQCGALIMAVHVESISEERRGSMPAGSLPNFPGLEHKRAVMRFVWQY